MKAFIDEGDVAEEGGGGGAGAGGGLGGAANAGSGPVGGGAAVSRQHQWCVDRCLPHECLSEAATTYYDLIPRLYKQRLDTGDHYEGVWNSAEADPPPELKRNVLRCLCEANVEYALYKEVADPSRGLLRILNSDDAQSANQAQAAFVKKLGPKAPAPAFLAKVPSAGGEDDEDGDVAADGDAGDEPEDADEEAERAAAEEAQMELAMMDRSAMWFQKVQNYASSVSTDAAGPPLIYHSLLQTDGGRMLPLASIVSVVTTDLFTPTSPGAVPGPTPMPMPKLPERVTFFVDIGQKNKMGMEVGRLPFVKDNGAWLQQFRKRYPMVAIDLHRKPDPEEDDGLEKYQTQLKVTCPKRMQKAVEQLIRKQRLSENVQDVTMDLPPGTKLGAFLKAGGLQSLHDEVHDLLLEHRALDEQTKAVGKYFIHFEGQDPASGGWSEKVQPQTRVRVQLAGRAKTLGGVIVGRVRSTILEACVPQSAQQLSWKDTGLVSLMAPQQLGEGQLDPMVMQRMMLLNTKSKPPMPTTREQAVLHLAHAAIWDAGCKVYGGFLRDWLLCGKEANDIDVNTVDVDGTDAKIATAVKPFGLTRGTRFQKGAACTVTFDFQGQVCLEVDLVDPKTVPNNPPGVDCDAGNFAFDCQHGLQLKCTKPGLVDLPTSIKHAQEKRFVLYYQPATDYSAPYQRRLKKYVQRGWTCLSPVPSEALQVLHDQCQNHPGQGGSSMTAAQVASRLKPQDEYNVQWWHK